MFAIGMAYLVLGIPLFACFVPQKLCILLSSRTTQEERSPEEKTTAFAQEISHQQKS
jgi:hypothetical protein